MKLDVFSCPDIVTFSSASATDVAYSLEFVCVL